MKREQTRASFGEREGKGEEGEGSIVPAPESEGDGREVGDLRADHEELAGARDDLGGSSSDDHNHYRGQEMIIIVIVIIWRTIMEDDQL